MKPKVLYHASPNTNIKAFEPRDKSTRTPGEGKLVFATPDPRVAAMFLVPSEVGPSEIGVYDDRAVIIINATPHDLEAKDQGGAIYTLPSTTFTVDPKLGMGVMEWTSKVAVEPIDKKVYPSAIQALAQFGVEIYLVDDAMFRNIQSSEDYGWSMLESLHPYSR